MKFLGLTITRERKQAKSDEIDEKRQIRLDHEKAVLEEKFKTIKKQQELDQILLDMKIKEQQCLMDEKYSDVPEEVEEVIEDVVEDDVPAWLKPMLPAIIAKFSQGNTQPAGNSTTNNSPQQTQQETAGLSLTDEELQLIKQSTPKSDLITLKNLPQAQQKSIIKTRYPKITEECLERAVKILQS
jgi:hypothetical protein